MSRHVRYDWELQKELRRQEYLNRVRSTTAQFYERYDAILRDLVRQQLDQYLPAEFAAAQSQVARIGYLLNSDPEQARDFSQQMGPTISRLPAMARSAQREFEEREQQRRAELAQMRRQAQSELQVFLHDAISQVRDPVERDFAFDGLREIRATYHGRQVEPTELARLKAEIGSRVDAVVRSAQQQATAWKASKQQETRSEAQNILISVHEEALQQDGDRNPAAVAAPLEALKALRREVEAGRSRPDSEIEAAVRAAARQADEAIVDEACRRKTVGAVIAALETAGFVTDPPELHEGERNEVVIAARKPAGAEAEFRVTADGGMTFKFDRYHGMRCKEDIDTVLPLLQQAYGIELSKERVLWENPIKISADERPLATPRSERNG